MLSCPLKIVIGLSGALIIIPEQTSSTAYTLSSLKYVVNVYEIMRISPVYHMFYAH